MTSDCTTYMSMYFISGEQVTILFDGWDTENTTQYTFSLIFIFFASALIEFLSFTRRKVAKYHQKQAKLEYLEAENAKYLQNLEKEQSARSFSANQPAKDDESKCCSTDPESNQPKVTSLTDLTQVQPINTVNRQKIDWDSSMGNPAIPKWGKSNIPRILLRTLLYVVQIFISWCVMLTVMTYNEGLFIAAMAGYGFGFFLFSDNQYK